MTPARPLLALLLAVATPSLSAAVCQDSRHLQKLEKFSLQTRSTMLLDCSYHHSYGEAGGFLLMHNGRSQEFSTDRKYTATSRPFLSPDARQIVYAGFVDKAAELVILDVASGTAKIIYSGDEKLTLWAWTQDGSQLVVHNKSLQKLELVRLSDGFVSTLIPLAGQQGSVYRGSPDLRWIAIEEDQDHPERVYVIKWKLYLANLESGVKRFVADGWQSVWSPQSDKIAYLTPDAMKCFAVSLSGGKPPQRLFSSLNFSRYIYQEELSGPLVWSPDQRYLAYHQSAGLKGNDRTVYIYDSQRKRKHKFLGAGAMIIVDWK